jgi:phytoene/squalene synthetase
MHKQYTSVSLACSKLLTNAYSTSFSLGIFSLHKKNHEAIYAIYGFVRLADEIVDTFLEQDKKTLLEKFKKDTYDAIADGISLNPILHSFQWVVNAYQIDHSFIEAFFYSMEMDLTDHTYDKNLYEKYIYGSAEVIGLMCLKIFCNNNNTSFKKLQPYAQHLGAAFQKINFLRDLKSDYEERGRVYFPNVQYETFNNIEKVEIEKDIEIDFNKGLEGIKKLPIEAKFGVFLAHQYYLALLNKIKLNDVEALKANRIRISNPQKLFIYITSKIRFYFI